MHARRSTLQLLLDYVRVLSSPGLQWGSSGFQWGRKAEKLSTARLLLEYLRALYQ